MSSILIKLRISVCEKENQKKVKIPQFHNLGDYIATHITDKLFISRIREKCLRIRNKNNPVKKMVKRYFTEGKTPHKQRKEAQCHH